MDKGDNGIDHMPKYLERLPVESLQNVIDSFIVQNDSDEEEFYDNHSEAYEEIRKRYPKRKMYKTIEEFECGYEKKHNEDTVNSILRHESVIIKKYYLKDVLKLDFGVFDYDLPADLTQSQRKLKGDEFVFKNLPEVSRLKDNQVKKKEEEPEEIVIDLQRVDSSKENMKIMTVSQSLKIKYDLLEPYIKNYYKHEDASDQIEILDQENKLLKHKFDVLHFKETPHEHSVIFGLTLPQLEKRASLLVSSRFNESYQAMSIILKFLVFLKKLTKDGGRKKPSSSNVGTAKRSLRKNDKLLKVKNTILSYRNLSTCFQESKDSNQKEQLVSSLKATISDFEKKKRDELFVSLKEKMRGIINEDDNSMDQSRMHYAIEDTPIKDKKDSDIPQSKLRESLRKNKREGTQKDINYKEATPEFLPQHKSKYKKELKSYIQSQMKGKK